MVSDLQLQFEWRSSSGLWALLASALEYSHNHTTFRGARISEAGRAASAGITVAAPCNRSIVLVPADCDPIPGADVLEIASGWYFDTKHVLGVLNNVADGVWRWPRHSVTTNLIAFRPDVSWYEQVIGDPGNQLCCNILDSSLLNDPLRERLRRLTKDILGHSFASGAT